MDMRNHNRNMWNTLVDNFPKWNKDELNKWGREFNKNRAADPKRQAELKAIEKNTRK